MKKEVKTPEALDRITDVVLRYRPKDKKKLPKRRASTFRDAIKKLNESIGPGIVICRGLNDKPKLGSK